MMANKADAEDCAKRLLCEIARQCFLKARYIQLIRKQYSDASCCLYFLVFADVAVDDYVFFVFVVGVDFVIGVSNDLGLG